MSGGFAKVYSAKGEIDGLGVAIKEFKIRSNNEDDYKEQLQENHTESTNLASLPTHLNIIAYKQTMVLQNGGEYSVNLSPLSPSTSSPPMNMNSVRSVCEDLTNWTIETPAKPSSNSDEDMDEDEENYSEIASPGGTFKFTAHVLIVTEYCKNGNLDKQIGIMTLNRCFDIFLQILAGVSAIHKVGLLHRDLKPAKIFFQGSTAKIGDFGLSCKLDCIKSDRAGTPFYSSPEQRKDKAHGTSSDVSSELQSYSTATLQLTHACVISLFRCTLLVLFFSKWHTLQKVYMSAAMGSKTYAKAAMGSFQGTGLVSYLHFLRTRICSI